MDNNNISTLQRSSRRQTISSVQVLIDAYRNTPSQEHKSIALRLQHCRTPTQWLNPETGEVNEGLHHCDIRSCPSCQRRRQRKAVRDLRSWITKLISNEDGSLKYSFLFLSIGYRNVLVTDARQQLRRINQGLKGLRNRSKRWPGLGTITSHEFTIAQDGLIHFNTHSLIAVSPSYFKAPNYLEHTEWVEEITKHFKLSQAPSVDVRKVRGATPRDVENEFIYVFDYVLKPQDFAGNPEVGVLLGQQLHGTRRVSYAGVFKLEKQKWAADSKKSRRKSAATTS